MSTDIPRLPPRSQPEERERVIVNALLQALQDVPRLVEATERIEQAVLVSSGAAHRAEAAVDKHEVILRRLERVVGMVEQKLNGKDRPISHHDLEEAVNELGEKIEGATNPGIQLRQTDSDRVRKLTQEAIDKRELDDRRKRDAEMRSLKLGIVGTAIAGLIVAAASAYVFHEKGRADEHESMIHSAVGHQ